MTRQPSEIGKYRIERRLGQGGMGTVYLARDSRIGRYVALKLLRVDDDETRMRFEAEAQSAGRLKHPNIVTIHDYGDVEGFPFIVMEYVEGSTLAAMIAHEPLPVARRLALIEQVCHALAYAHRAGIIHRDIKPSNLMLDENGVIKLLDFGIARNIERALTRSGRLLGTAAYMSPEQVRGEPVDRRCDIFAVGVVLYEALTGRRAFPGDSEYVVYDRILTSTPEPFDHPDPRVTAAIQPLLDRSLAKNPDDRYQDADSFADALARVRELVAGLGEQTRVERPVSAPAPRFKAGDSRMAPSIRDEAMTVTPWREPQVASEAKRSPPPSAKSTAAARPPQPDEEESTRDRERAGRIAAAMVRARDHAARGQWDNALRAGSEVLVDDPDYEAAHDIIQEALTRIQEQRRASSVLITPAAGDASAEQIAPWQSVEITRAVEPPIEARKESRSSHRPQPIPPTSGRWMLAAAVAALIGALAGAGYLFRARWTSPADQAGRRETTQTAPAGQTPETPAPTAVQPGGRVEGPAPSSPPAGGPEPRLDQPAVKATPPPPRIRPEPPSRPASAEPVGSAPVNTAPLTIRLSEASALFEQGDYDASIAAYDAILRDFPKNMRAFQGIRRARNAQAAQDGVPDPGPRAGPDDRLAPRRQELQDRLDSAQRRYDNGEYDAAIAEFEAVLKANPGNKIAENGIARARKAKQIDDPTLKPRRPPS